MRELRFSLYDRLVLIPVEIVLELKTLAAVAGLVLLTCVAAGDLRTGWVAFGAYAGAVFSGVAVAPLLLPWLPSKRFALKGALLGLLWALCCYLLTGDNWSPLATGAAFLLLPAISAYHTLSFTGCTPFTSRSGVTRELRSGFPVIGGALVAGTLLLALSRFL